MIVSSQLVRTDGHVRPDVVLRMLSPRVQRIMEVFNCLVALAFCGGLVWFGWQIVNTALLLDETSSTALEFPMWIYYVSLPVGAGLMLIRYVMRLVRYVFFFDPATMTVGHSRARSAARHGEPAAALMQAAVLGLHAGLVFCHLLRPALVGHADLPGARHLRGDPVLRLRRSR